MSSRSSRDVIADPDELARSHVVLKAPDAASPEELSTSSRLDRDSSICDYSESHRRICGKG